MKRLLSFFALMCIGFSVLQAQVTVSPSPLYKGFTGTVKLTFDPTLGNGGMATATECYSHIGLLTTASADDTEWMYIKDPNWGTTSQPEWTKEGDKWTLTIDDFYDWFGCPYDPTVNALVMVFHDGKGSESKQGKTATNGNIVINLADPTPRCSYTLIMNDSYGDGWNGNYLVFKDHGYTFGYTFPTGSKKIVTINSYGTDSDYDFDLEWVEGYYEDETYFTLFAKNGSILFNGDYSSLPKTISNDPCSTAANIYEIENLKVTSLDQKDYTFSWDDNTNVDKYWVQIYAPSGKGIKNFTTTSLSYSYDFDNDNISEAGEYTIMVTPLNSSDEVLALHSTTTFTVDLPDVGIVTMRLLIPSDSYYDPSNGVRIIWEDMINYETDTVVMEQESGTRWWKATFDVPYIIYQYSIQTPEVDGVVHYTYRRSTRDNSVCGEVLNIDSKGTTSWGYDVDWTVDCHAADHNYNIKDATLTGGTAQVSFSITLLKDTAYRYRVALYDEDGNEWEYFNIYKADFRKDTTIILYNGEDAHIRRWVIQPYNSSSEAIGQRFEQAVTVDILKSPLATANIEVVHNSDDSYTVSWDAVTGVDKFEVYFGDYYYYFISKEVLTSTPPIDGRYSVTSAAGIAPEGWATVDIGSYVYNTLTSTYDYKTYLEYKFLSRANLNVLIPDDCDNFDTSAGVYAWCWLPDVVNSGRCVKLTQDGNWWRADFYIDHPSYQFIVVNKEITSEADWAGAQQSVESEEVIYSSHYTQLRYKTAGKEKWPLVDASSSSSNHDYRIDNVDVDTSTPGEATITITPKSNYAYFNLTITAGTQKFNYLDFGNTTKTIELPNAVDVDVTYTIAPIDYKGDTLAAPYNGSCHLPANANAPGNLKAEVQSDGQTVKFSWTTPANAPTSYKLIARDESKFDWIYYTLPDGSATEVTGFVYYEGKCTWKLTTYDEYGNEILTIEGPDFVTTDTKDYTPKDLTVTVDAMTATLRWTAHENVTAFRVYAYKQGSSSYTTNSGYSTNKVDGKFQWSFTAPSADNYYFKIHTYHRYEGSYWAYLTTVKTNPWSIPGGTEIVPPTYTLTISAGEGGSVNSEVNGVYEENEVVTISATAATGYVFEKWSDGNVNATRNITMNADKTLQATFLKMCNLSITAQTGGTVNSAVNGTYVAGTSVNISASANTGYHFDAWSDGNTSANRTIIMDKDYNLSAHFLEDKQYNVKVSAGPNGKVTTINGKYYGLSVIHLEATPNEDYVVEKWSDDEKERSTVRDIIITQDTTIKVTFREKEYYRLTVEIRPAKSGTVKLNGEVREENTLKVEEGKSIEVSATPAEGYKFKRYTYDDEPLTSDATTSILMNRNKTIVAVFEEAVEAVDNVAAEQEGAELFMENGCIYIRRAGKIYTVQGKLVE